MVSAMMLGADCIEDCDVLRSGQTAAVLGHRVSAPSTLGTFLRAFTFGHVRQLDAVLAETPDAGLGGGRRAGRRAPGRRCRFVRRRGPRLRKAGRRASATPESAATTRFSRRARAPARCCTYARARARRTPRAARCASSKNCIPRVARAGATGPMLLRADSGFWNKKLMARLRRRGLALLDRRAPPGRGPGGDRRDPRDRLDHARRLPPRRRSADRPDDDRPPAPGRPAHPPARSAGRAVARLAALRVSDQPHRPLDVVEAEHRQHAVVELAIRDLKDQAPRALSLRHVLRQRRLDGDRRARAQPAALDRPHRAARHDHPHRSAPCADGCSRSPDD